MRYNPKYEINMVSILTRMGKNTRQVRQIIQNPEFKRDFGQAVVDSIIVRTRDGNKDKNNRPFPSYEKSYIDSPDFSAYGKSPGDINLTLTGDMLDSLKFKTSGYTVTLNLTGAKNASKAQGHIDGIKTKKGKLKRRDFLGMTQKDEESVMRELLNIYKDDVISERLSDERISPDGVTIEQTGRGTTSLELELGVE